MLARLFRTVSPFPSFEERYEDLQLALDQLSIEVVEAIAAKQALVATLMHEVGDLEALRRKLAGVR